MATHRRFVCAPKDLARFTARVEQHIKREVPSKYCPTVKDFFKNALKGKVKDLEMYGLEVDEISREHMNLAVSRLSIEELHYALHHLIWQMWDYGNKNPNKVNRNSMVLYTKITEDCLYSDPTTS